MSTQLAPALPIPAGLWIVDPETSEIGFAVKGMWGLQTVRGVFRRFDGSLAVGEGEADGRLTIETAGLDTGNQKRDEHLRSTDFFDVGRNPRIVFATTGIAAGERPLISGLLTIGSAQAEIRIPVEVERGADGSIVVSGESSVAREAVGLTWNKLGAMGKDAKLHARLTLRSARA